MRVTVDISSLILYFILVLTDVIRIIVLLLLFILLLLIKRHASLHVILSYFFVIKYFFFVSFLLISKVVLHWFSYWITTNKNSQMKRWQPSELNLSNNSLLVVIQSIHNLLLNVIPRTSFILFFIPIDNEPTIILSFFSSMKEQPIHY